MAAAARPAPLPTCPPTRQAVAAVAAAALGCPPARLSACPPARWRASMSCLLLGLAASPTAAAAPGSFVMRRAGLAKMPYRLALLNPQRADADVRHAWGCGPRSRHAGPRNAPSQTCQGTDLEVFAAAGPWVTPIADMPWHRSGSGCCATQGHCMRVCIPNDLGRFGTLPVACNSCPCRSVNFRSPRPIRLCCSNGLVNQAPGHDPCDRVLVFRTLRSWFGDPSTIDIFSRGHFGTSAACSTP